MREKKSFFTENNQLNKGYRSENKLATKATFKVGAADLPEASVLAAYEEMQPGTISKMIEMTAKEQEHRHNIELLHLKMQKIGVRMGRLFAIFAVMAICYTAYAMSAHNMQKEAVIFACIGFVAMAISACAGRCKSNNLCGTKDKANPGAPIADAPMETKKRPTEPRSTKVENGDATTAATSTANNYKPYYRRRKRETK
jgi:uncharacterized membrane protein